MLSELAGWQSEARPPPGLWSRIEAAARRRQSALRRRAWAQRLAALVVGAAALSLPMGAALASTQSSAPASPVAASLASLQEELGSLYGGAGGEAPPSFREQQLIALLAGQ